MDPNQAAIHPELTEPEVLKDAEAKVFYATQWQLMWWKFRKHKAAMAALVIVVMMYLGAFFAPMIAPYRADERHRGYVYVPPQKIRFYDEQGFSLRPFVYPLRQEIDMETMQRHFIEDPTTRVPIHFFVRGSSYKLLGLFPADIHLFGAEDGKVFLFGTDDLGRDMFSRILFGGQISMSIGLVGVFLSLFLGLLFGGISGYYGGAVDNVIQRVIEVLRSFPTIPLWMALSAALPPDLSPIGVYMGITIILSLIGWTALGRQVRGKVLAIKNEDFVIAARLSGTSEPRIILSHLIPSFMSHIIASLTLAIPSMILAETSLSFLGIGLRPPVVSWGVMLQKAQNVHALMMAPWLLIPGIFVILYVLAFNFLGDGLRDAADPYGN
ncbi:MAG: ABC transporter permease [Bacillota bacterium]|jgi:peptide/nickel transport system permease protein|nr:ABC transporter permease [Bacillota bacterium]HHT89553.1 ABC transporter permease [Bacillota bacterium]